MIESRREREEGSERVRVGEREREEGRGVKKDKRGRRTFMATHLKVCVSVGLSVC